MCNKTESGKLAFKKKVIINFSKRVILFGQVKTSGGPGCPISLNGPGCGGLLPE